MGAGATPSVSTASLWVTGKAENDSDAQSYITIIGVTDAADPTSLVTADYNNCGAVNNPTKQTDTDRDISADLTVGAYNTFALNATGIGNISVTDKTLFGCREGHDIEDVTLSGGAGVWNEVGLSMSEHADTTQDPKLVTTFTPGGAADTAVLDLTSKFW